MDAWFEGAVGYAADKLLSPLARDWMNLSLANQDIVVVLWEPLADAPQVWSSSEYLDALRRRANPLTRMQGLVPGVAYTFILGDLVVPEDGPAVTTLQSGVEFIDTVLRSEEGDPSGGMTRWASRLIIPGRVTSRPRTLAYYRGLAKVVGRGGPEHEKTFLQVISRWSAAIDEVEAAAEMAGLSHPGSSISPEMEKRARGWVLQDVLTTGSIQQLAAYSQAATRELAAAKVARDQAVAAYLGD